MDGWLLAGAAGGSAMIAMCWQYIRSAYQQVAGRVVMTCVVHGRAADAVMYYCRQAMHTSKFGRRAYIGEFAYVRPRRRWELIALEQLGRGTTRLFWRGWRPILLSRPSNQDDDMVTSRPVEITYLRGTLDPDWLVDQAVEAYNNLIVSGINETRRFQIVHVSGTDGKPATFTSGGGDDSGAAVSPRARASLEFAYINRLLRYNPGDIGPGVRESGAALDRLALSPEAEQFVAEVKDWRNSRQWHQDRSVPWKMGATFFGPPGTGKTALVRALAEDLDLPLFSFDLPTLYNDELRYNWSAMMSNTPCIALLEDLDTVFDGRENRKGHLTFDCLLNAIDGVDNTDGLLVIITTNHIEKLDPALGGCDSGTAEIAPRPGRIDRIIEMTALDESGRIKICATILAGYEHLWDDVLRAGIGDTGAQFQRRCCRAARQLFMDELANKGKEACRKRPPRRKLPSVIGGG